MPYLLDRRIVEVLFTLDDRQHFTVEIAKIMITKLLVVHQIPLSAGVLIAPSIAFTREVDPLRMSEFIAHEIQITAVDGCCRSKTDHLVQGYATVYHFCLVSLPEVPVHIRVHQTEDDCLVAHQCLIMRLAVRDGLLVHTTVFDFPEDGRRLPCLIGQFLDGLDPVVRDVHGHTIVEAITAILKPGSQTGHARHLFCNGKRILVDFMDKAVGQSKVADGIIIFMSVEVITIVAESLSQSMAVIKHRSDTIKAEAVEMIFFQPVFAVGEEEVENLILSIVKAE